MARYSFAAPQAAPTFATATGDGYRVVTADGAIYPFGDAGHFGAMNHTKLNGPIVGMAASH